MLVLEKFIQQVLNIFISSPLTPPDPKPLSYLPNIVSFLKKKKTINFVIVGIETQ